ncbi:MAG: hypothetical protein P8103_17830 [Candidatus Thiodiazotropha sp.]
MDIISHANVMPWLVDTPFFVQMIAQAMLAVFLLSCLGLIYAGLRRMLANGVESHSSESKMTGGMKGTGDAWKCPRDLPGGDTQ